MAERKRKRQERERYTPEEIAVAVGPRLCEARKAAALTQVELAERMQIVPAYVSMAERGQRLPSMEVVVAWAVACGVPVAYLFTGIEESLEGRGT